MKRSEREESTLSSRYKNETGIPRAGEKPGSSQGKRGTVNVEKETEDEKWKNAMHILERFLLWEVSDQTGRAISSWCRHG